MAKGLVLEQIAIERERQDRQWGGPVHDDDHTLDTWWSFLERHWDKFSDAFAALRAEDGDASQVLAAIRPSDPRIVAELRHRAVVVAALMVALVESNDRTYPADARSGEASE